MKKYYLFFGSVCVFILSATAAHAACQLWTCDLNCASWSTAAQKDECIASCRQQNLEAEWNGYYQSCLQSEQASQQPAPAPTPAPTPTPVQPSPSPVTTPSYEQWSELPSYTAQPSTEPAQQGPAVIRLDASNLAPGKQLMAPEGMTATVTTQDLHLDIKAGSIINFIDKDIWEPVVGTFRFVVEQTKARKFRVRSATNVLSVRGTQFIVDKKEDGSMTVQVQKGSLDVTDLNGKNGKTVKAGYEITASATGIGQPVKIKSADSSWYDETSLAPSVRDISWDKESLSVRYKKSCVYTASNAEPAETLTAEEQKVVDGLNKSLKVYRVTTEDVYLGREGMLQTMREKRITTGKQAATIFLNAKNIYYKNSKPTWKKFALKQLTDSLFATARDQNLTWGINKDSLMFERWEGAPGSRVAVISGKLTTEGNESFITSAMAKDAAAGQELTNISIQMDEETRLWNSYTADVRIKTGKIYLPLHGTCTMTYGDAVKLTAPKSATSLKSDKALKELMDLMTKVQ